MTSFILRKASLRTAAALMAMTLVVGLVIGAVLVPRFAEASGASTIPDAGLFLSYGQTRSFFEAASREGAMPLYRAVELADMAFPALYALALAFIIALGVKGCGLRGSPWRRLCLLPLAGAAFDYAENGILFALSLIHPGKYRVLAGFLAVCTAAKFAFLLLALAAMAVLSLVAISRMFGKRCVSTVRAPAAIGPYSQAVRSGDFLFLSGQLGMDPETGALAVGVKAQAERALDNLSAILEDQGLTMADIVKTTIFLTNMSDFQAVNEAYASNFTGDFPARSTVQVAALPKGGLVEIEAIAKLT